MAIKNLDIIEAAAAKRAEARKRKGKPRMRVSGAGVKKLQKIIGGK
jgi:hypothetical protein